MDDATIRRALAAAGDTTVRAFQKARGLAVDGIVGPATTAALEAVLAANDNKTAPGTGQVFIPGLLITDVKKLCPRANALWATALVAGWADVVRLGKLTTATRARHFLAQTAEESGGFTVFQENLQGYTAARLMQVWPSRFKTLASAQPYAHNAEALANLVYGGRKDLGNILPGDGWRYHGMGPLQATGRAWAEKLSKATGLLLVAHPELMLTPEIGWKTSAACWDLIGANAFADKGDLAGETKRINGGLTNLAERQRYLTIANGLKLAPVAAPVAMAA